MAWLYYDTWDPIIFYKSDTNINSIVFSNSSTYHNTYFICSCDKIPENSHLRQNSLLGHNLLRQIALFRNSY